MMFSSTQTKVRNMRPIQFKLNMQIHSESMSQKKRGEKKIKFSTLTAHLSQFKIDRNQIGK